MQGNSVARALLSCSFVLTAICFGLCGLVGQAWADDVKMKALDAAYAAGLPKTTGQPLGAADRTCRGGIIGRSTR